MKIFEDKLQSINFAILLRGLTFSSKTPRFVVFWQSIDPSSSLLLDVNKSDWGTTDGVQAEVFVYSVFN